MRLVHFAVNVIWLSRYLQVYVETGNESKSLYAPISSSSTRLLALVLSQRASVCVCLCVRQRKADSLWNVAPIILLILTFSPLVCVCLCECVFVSECVFSSSTADTTSTTTTTCTVLWSAQGGGRRKGVDLQDVAPSAGGCTPSTAPDLSPRTSSRFQTWKHTHKKKKTEREVPQRE